jgi:hypothetical protein
MNNPPEIISVTKLDAARRHLSTAIRLWFHDGDPVSIHTLGYAAYEVIHVLSRKANRTDTLIFDSDLVKDEFRSEFNKLVKKAPNFFKHADKDANSTLEFKPKFSEMFFLFSALGLETMGLKIGGEEKVFLIWFSIHNPEIMVDGAVKRFLDGFPIKTIDEVKLMPKSEFFKHVMIGHTKGLKISLTKMARLVELGLKVKEK